MISFYEKTHSELVKVFSDNELRVRSVDDLFNWYYKKANTEPCEIKISKKVENFLSENFIFELPKILEAKQSKDKTVKFLFELKDGLSVETVLIPFNKKYSICLSSQVGCGMNCSFCFTGYSGLKEKFTYTRNYRAVYGRSNMANTAKTLG